MLHPGRVYLCRRAAPSTSALYRLSRSCGSAGAVSRAAPVAAPIVEASTIAVSGAYWRIWKIHAIGGEGMAAFNRNMGGPHQPAHVFGVTGLPSHAMLSHA